MNSHKLNTFQTGKLFIGQGNLLAAFLSRFICPETSINEDKIFCYLKPPLHYNS